MSAKLLEFAVMLGPTVVLVAALLCSRLRRPRTHVDLEEVKRKGKIVRSARRNRDAQLTQKELTR